MTTEISYERAAQGMARGRPLGLGAWLEVTRTGTLTGDRDPDGTAAGLVRRWYQHLAVAMDTPLERLAPGADRLPALLDAWLDLARRTAAVRAHVAATAGPLASAEQDRQGELLAGLLAEDLALLGAVEPRRSARDLLASLAEVAEAEDAAGRPLPRLRRALLGGEVPAQQTSWRDRLSGWLHPAPAA